MIIHTIISEYEVMSGYKEDEYSLYMNEFGEISRYKAGNTSLEHVYVTNPQSFLKAGKASHGISPLANVRNREGE